MNDLQKCRLEIDTIDRKIVKLLEERLDVVLRVAEYKSKNQTSVLHTDREQEVINNAVENLTNKDYAPYIKELITDVMAVSKKLQTEYIHLQKQLSVTTRLDFKE